MLDNGDSSVFCVWCFIFIYNSYKCGLINGFLFLYVLFICYDFKLCYLCICSVLVNLCGVIFFDFLVDEYFLFYNSCFYNCLFIDLYDMLYENLLYCLLVLVIDCDLS